MEKSGRHHLNQVIKVHNGSNETNRHHVPPDRMHWEEHHIPSLAFLPEMQNLSLIKREHQTDPNWGTSTKCPTLFRNVSVRNQKDRLKPGFRFKVTREVWQTNITPHLGFSFPIKDITGTAGKIWIRSVGGLIINVNVNFFLILISVVWLHKRMSLFFRETLWHVQRWRAWCLTFQTA